MTTDPVLGIQTGPRLDQLGDCFLDQIQIAFLGTIQQLLRSRRGLCVCASERACVCLRVCVRVV